MGKTDLEELIELGTIPALTKGKIPPKTKRQLTKRLKELEEAHGPRGRIEKTAFDASSAIAQFLG
jgi:hypothetical protein